MICSRCRLDLPTDAFRAARRTHHRKQLASGDEVVYRYTHARGRSYLCRKCEAEHAKAAYHRRKARKAQDLAPSPAEQCAHGLSGDRCPRRATWRDPDPRCCWRACDEHKMLGDDPIPQQTKELGVLTRFSLQGATLLV